MRIKKQAAVAVVAFALGTAGLAAFQNCSNFAVDLASSRVTGKTLMGFDPNAPLTIGASTNIVVMEYSPWFGPTAQHFPSVAKPLLKSKSMTEGYDSIDPNVLATHTAQIEAIGADALLADLSNGTMCSFSADVSDCGANGAAVKIGFDSMKARAFNLYPAFTGLRTSLKIIPLLGADSDDIFRADSTGRMVLLKEFDQWTALMNQYPNLNVILDGKPLITIFMGAGQDTSSAAAWRKVQSIFNTYYGSRFTLRLVSGLISNQSALWNNSNEGATYHQLSPNFPFWSWRDRYRSDKLLYPSFYKSPTSGRVENFAISAATPGYGIAGGASITAWGNQATGVYDAYAGLRRGGATLSEMMNMAIQLKPQFLLINEWANFQASADSGYDSETIGDIEPNTLQGNAIYDQYKSEIARYKATLQMPTAGFIRQGGAAFLWNGFDAICSITSPLHYKLLGGTADVSSLPEVLNIPSPIRNDGRCGFKMPIGFVYLEGAIGTVLNSNGQGHVCVIATPAQFTQMGGKGDVTALPHIPFIPDSIANDGTCVSATTATPVTSAPVTSTAPSGVTRVLLYRMYNNGNRLYTLYEQEGIRLGYSTEATFYLLNSPSGNSSPVYRCFKGFNFVSRDAACEGGTHESLLGYVYNTQVAGSSPLYRFWDPYNGNLILSSNSQEGIGVLKFDTNMGYSP